MEWLRKTFGAPKPVIGMVHLLPLPGSPSYRGGGLDQILKRALEDAKALEEGGAHGLIVENLGDAPYLKTRVGPETVAAMAAAVGEVKKAVQIPVGVNVLRNDARAALAIAHASGAEFIRVNVFVEALLTDQGVIEACAPELLRYRSELGAEVKIFADVHGKHGVPLIPRPIEHSALDAARRGLADALIVSGPRTGAQPELEELRRVKQAVPDKPVLVGSGLTAENARVLLEHADGAIVGTSLKVEGKLENPVDEGRVKALLRALEG